MPASGLMQKQLYSFCTRSLFAHWKWEKGPPSLAFLRICTEQLVNDLARITIPLTNSCLCGQARPDVQIYNCVNKKPHETRTIASSAWQYNWATSCWHEVSCKATRHWLDHKQTIHEAWFEDKVSMSMQLKVYSIISDQPLLLYYVQTMPIV